MNIKSGNPVMTNVLTAVGTGQCMHYRNMFLKGEWESAFMHLIVLFVECSKQPPSALVKA
jgi:hypothetical protein